MIGSSVFLSKWDNLNLSCGQTKYKTLFHTNLFPEVSLVTEVKSGRLRNEHDNVDQYGDQLVVGGQQGILNRGRAISMKAHHS